MLGGRVQAMGVNQNTIDPFFHPDASRLSIHAEEAALRRCKRTQGAVLYVARVNNAGEPRMSRPCKNCMPKLISAGIKRVVYTIDKVIEC